MITTIGPRRIIAVAMLLSVAAFTYARGVGEGAHGGAYKNPEYLVSPQDLAEQMGKKNLLVIDVRKPEDFGASHIPGAINLPPSHLEYVNKLKSGAEVRAIVKPADEIGGDLRNAGINKNSRIVIYDVGGSALATRVWWILDYYGHRNIAILNGGLTAWEDNGLDITTEVTAMEPGNFTPVADPSKIADYEYVKAHLGSDATAICDALSAKSYADGAIERTINLPFSDQFATDEVPLLKGAEELNAALLELNMTEDKELIFYCGAGYAASVDYFVARLLGRDKVRLYDGSLRDWRVHGEALLPSGGI